MEKRDTPWPAWCEDNGARITVAEIREAFHILQETLGFQKHNEENMTEYLMVLLDSRASRMSCPQALLSLHADYIGGDHSNYKKWYFVACYDEENNLDKKSVKNKWKDLPKFMKGERGDVEDPSTLWSMDYQWRSTMKSYTEMDYVYQLALYLLVWGEANNLRFMPECICFLYKQAFDYFQWSQQNAAPGLEEYFYLDNVVTPIYRFLYNQQLEDLEEGKKRRINKDHSRVIGYDDINLFFWFGENLKKLTLADGSLFLKIPRHQRYLSLGNVKWDTGFVKTYKEVRSWLHLLVNFSRIWIIHACMFWFFFSFNCPSIYTWMYDPATDNSPAPQIQLVIVGLGGAIGAFLVMFSTIMELCYVPRKWGTHGRLWGRFFCSTLVFVANCCIPVYIFMFKPWTVYSRLGILLGWIQLFLAIATTLYFGLVPPERLFAYVLPTSVKTMKSSIFTKNYASMARKNRLFSMLLWTCVFTFKFIESYFFLTLSLRDPVKILWSMDTSRCVGDIWLGKLVCENYAKILVFLLIVTNFVLFFLDTYLWYVICSCIISMILVFTSGASSLKPWKAIFAKLPGRILTKIHYSFEEEAADDTNFAVSRIWNSFVISLFKEHLLSIEQLNRLLYRQVPGDNKIHVNYAKQPPFFDHQEDLSIGDMSSFFEKDEEASRRICFFARSLACPLPQPYQIEGLPLFTVLIPHYSEKILLSEKELIKETQQLKISLLDYLKKCFRSEWDSFVKDSKLYNQIHTATAAELDEKNSVSEDEDLKRVKSNLDDIPFYSVGYLNNLPELVLRTRIWASLRYQTVYRTLSGFSNYESALKSLYYAQNYDFESEYLSHAEDVEKDLNIFSKRKFRLLVSMQRFQEFNEEEIEATNVLKHNFPDLYIASIDKRKNENGELEYYSVLHDGGPFDLPKFRIKLSGDPILGDGKSDNQNHALIFHRGEYIQTIDANQDNYIEECLKIKSVLAEFEELELDPSAEYTPGRTVDPNDKKVAFVSAREYIVSEQTGVLGDVAAGKEKTFGTLFATTLSELNAKLHYGHPDFINSVFMFTRGGISKAQKGLHLNEDIYAGMNAICRGGSIKHIDYYQCGKGRDLGFGTIVNFTTKIGAGMGEQVISREHFQMGTTLPTDRFLSFYYAHAGFHLNNVFITLSVELFLLLLFSLGAFKHETIPCVDEAGEIPTGCYRLDPAFKWMTRFILSLFICFFISFLPLSLQEFTEKGALKALQRIGTHFISFAPMFEVFLCRVYSTAFKENLHFGGAKYTATGRGLATSRLLFPTLYSRYSDVSIVPGGICMISLIFATITLWQPVSVWYYISCGSLCMAPFLFNPHQFELAEFLLDYKRFLHWLFKGNGRQSKNSWVNTQKTRRVKFTSLKKKLSDPLKGSTVSTSRWSRLHLDIIFPFLEFLIYLIPYLFITSQTGVRDSMATDPILRVLILALFPILINLVFLLAFFPVSLVFSNMFRKWFPKFPSFISGFVLVCGILSVIITVQLNIVLHEWNLVRSLCAFVSVIKLQKWLRNVIYVTVLTKELAVPHVNQAWWTGKWKIDGLGWTSFFQVFREFVVKLSELTTFGYDFLLGTCIYAAMAPLALAPFADKLHTLMLFWLKPSRVIRDPILSKRQRRRRNFTVAKYSMVFFMIIAILGAIFIGPFFMSSSVPNLVSSVPFFLAPLFQPTGHPNNDTGFDTTSVSVPPLKTVL